MGTDFVVFDESESFTIPAGVDLTTVCVYMSHDNGEFVSLRPFVAAGGEVLDRASGTMRIIVEPEGSAIIEWVDPAFRGAVPFA